MEKDPAIFEEINYYVTCHLIFPTISYFSVENGVIFLAVRSPVSVAFLRNFARRLTRSFWFV